MDSTLRYRAFRKEDEAALTAIICEVWKMDDFLPRKTALQAAQIFLRMCKSLGTYTCVAEQNGVPIGFIAVQDKRTLRLHLYENAKLLKEMAALLLQKGMIKLLKMQSVTHAANQKMYKSAGQKYEAELVLFVVGKNSQGLGVGKALFRRALHHMKRRGIQKFYLYTDTFCNFGFYNVQGMRQYKSEHMPCFPCREVPVTFFLYDMVL